MDANQEYKLFRSWAPLVKMDVMYEGSYNEYVQWKYFDYGPKDSAETYPVVLIPGLECTITTFFQQYVALCPKGFRLITAEPVGITLDDHLIWVKSFHELLKSIGVKKAHVVGFQIGGLLAQMFAARYPASVDSLVLVNPVCDTQWFHDHSRLKGVLKIMPAFMLKSYILSPLPTTDLPPPLAKAIDFVATEIDAMSHDELATRLSLTYSASISANPKKLLDNSRVTVILSAEDDPYCTTPAAVREEVRKYYPEAQIAELRRGCGEFPHLVCPDDLNMYLQVHLRKVSALDKEEQEK